MKRDRSNDMKKSLGATMALVVMAIFVSLADAAITIKVAEVQNGVAVVQGSKAVPSAGIFWEGTRVTQANKGGNFSFTGVVPSDCIGTLSDGTAIEVALLNCTVLPPASPAAIVPQTGQTLCYNSLGTVINCSGTGQDGALRKGLAWPAPRFTDNANGTITDNLTKLIWAKNQNCFNNVTWATALLNANTLTSGACGITDGSVAGDWRVPNVMELLSLINYGVSGPYSYLSDQGFIGFSAAGCWSSTTLYDYPSVAFVVAFNNGDLIFI
jgi:hypothetical protein